MEANYNRSKGANLRLFVIFIIAILTAETGLCFGECDFDWKPVSSGIVGYYPYVSALTVHNGQLIVGGWFWIAGSVAANKIARWDGSSWQPLGSGMNGGYCYTPYVSALTVYNGELIAGGCFATAGDIDANNIARWDGSSWQSLGNGMNYPVYALTVYNGELIAGGYFTTAGDVDANYIAKRNGSSWQPLGSGMNWGGVNALIVYNGELIAGGGFTAAGGVPANNIAFWDGNSWWPLGSGMNNAVSALTVYNGELVAGGYFTSAGGVAANYIAQWDGSNWSALGSGMNNSVHALTVYNGELIAGGYFTTASGVDVNCIARWNGSSWQPLGSGMFGGSFSPYVSALMVYNGELIAGGRFIAAGDYFSEYWARWGITNSEGDFSGNGKVDLQDFAILASYWAHPCGGPDWCGGADMDENEIVDERDLANFALDWLGVRITSDLNHDCAMDALDLGRLAERWLDGDCLYNGWCYEADLNYDLTVDFADLAILAKSWLEVN